MITVLIAAWVLAVALWATLSVAWTTGRPKFVARAIGDTIVLLNDLDANNREDRKP